MWHQEFAKPLNVVILVKINLETQAYAHVVLFSSGLELSDEQLIDYYSLVSLLGDVGESLSSMIRT
jgi:hypothetical protein